MNILFLEQHPRFGGGSERVSLSICTYLRRSGHSTHLLYEREGDMVPAYSDVTTTTTRGEVMPLAVRRPVQALGSIWQLRRHLKKHRIDVVFTSQIGFVSLLGTCNQLFGTRSVVHLGLALSFTSPLYSWARGRISAAVVPSEPMRRQCVGLGWADARLHMIPNGVDLVRFKPGAAPAGARADLGVQTGTALIVFLGRLVEEKGVLTLLRAAQVLKSRGVRFHLLMAGMATADQLSALTKAAAELGLDPGEVSLREATDKPELLLGAADVAVVPSQWNEPFGLAAIEAMACGVATVVSDAGILPEIVGPENPQCVFAQRDAGQLADRISTFLGDAELRARTASSGHKRAVEKYGLEKCGRAYEKLLAAAAGGP